MVRLVVGRSRMACGLISVRLVPTTSRVRAETIRSRSGRELSTPIGFGSCTLRVQVPPVVHHLIFVLRGFLISPMAEDGVVLPTERKWKLPIFVFFKDLRRVLKMDSLGKEILVIAVPAAMALAADPVASLIDTAFIGRIGAVEIAAVGISIAIFNQVSKVAIFPLVSITTSFVAEEETIGRINNEAVKVQIIEKASMNKEATKELTQDDAKLENLENGSTPKEENKDLPPENSLKICPCKHLPPITDCNSNTSKIKKQKRNIPSASTALLFGAVLGILETLLLVLLANPFLSLMGVKSDSPMLLPAHKYLTVRSLGAPAVLLSLAMQGVFRGFKDTKTPLYATVAGDVANIILDPILIFWCNLGVSGAAIAHVLSQYLISLILLVKLMQQVDLLPPSLKALQFSRFLKNGFLLLFKVIAATVCVTLAASLAARLGTTQMAAFQICLQVWLTSSLLADGLAVAGQAIIATSFAEKNYEKATAAAVRVLQMGFVMGLGLALLVGLGLQFGSGVFTKDIHVRHIITIGIPFVAGTQPINSIAFVFDGVNFGASDFAYSAYSMILVAIGSIGSLFALYKAGGFVGIWVALSIFMGLRAIAGIWRMGTGTGPWSFLRK
ncbi:MATE efflux family protein [Artemisia annua]|uniref:Protein DETOXIFICATION n=1 Tax=Artemisia annua TaxID=35608 RepID=A0A2U1L3G8_ARTAN|nr:MATE efflux family protein [Artemisia annua]